MRDLREGDEVDKDQVLLRIDDNEVWGAEVNAASKLGEDTARGGEILVTDTFRDELPGEAFDREGTLFGSRTYYKFTG